MRSTFSPVPIEASVSARLSRMPAPVLVGLALLAAVAVGFGIGAFDPPFGGRVSSDAVADWVTTRAALAGLDPYGNVSELAGQFGKVYVSPGPEAMGPERLIHPRLPGMLLLQVPWALFPFEVAGPAAGLSALLGFAVAIGWVARLVGGRPSVALLILPLLVAHPFVRFAIMFGNSGAWLGALVIGALIMIRRGRQIPAGILLGIAALLRVFPLLFLVLTWRRGHRVATLSGAATFVLANMAGMAVFRIAPIRVVEALRASGAAWLEFPWNLSLVPRMIGLVGQGVGIVSILVALGLTWVVARSRLNESRAWAIVGVVGLLLSPISWDSYRSLLVLPFALLWSTRLAGSRVFVLVGVLVPYLIWSAGANVVSMAQAVIEATLIGVLASFGAGAMRVGRRAYAVEGGASCSTG